VLRWTRKAAMDLVDPQLQAMRAELARADAAEASAR
jgi:hypothetical protein